MITIKIIITNGKFILTLELEKLSKQQLRWWDNQKEKMIKYL